VRLEIRGEMWGRRVSGYSIVDFQMDADRKILINKTSDGFGKKSKDYWREWSSDWGELLWGR
jgi:hypothetical protein